MFFVDDVYFSEKIFLAKDSDSMFSGLRMISEKENDSCPARVARGVYYLLK